MGGVRKYRVNETFFEKIDTEEKAYWLGFIYADGYICKTKYQKLIGIALSSVDEEHLYKFRESLDSTHKICRYKTGKSCYVKGLDYSRIIISSHTLFDDLVKVGCAEHKTDKLFFPSEEIVPKELHMHFIRGYFDGDGSLIHNADGSWAYGFCGTNAFLDGIQSVLLENGIISHKYKNYVRKKGQIVHAFKIGGINQVDAFEKALYKNATIWLERKYDKYQEMLKQIEESAYKHRRVCDICGDATSGEYNTWYHGGKYHGKRLCQRHYLQVKNNGDILSEKPFKSDRSRCDVCGVRQSNHLRIVYKKGDYQNKCLCSKHYWQICTYGEIRDARPEKMKAKLERCCCICGNRKSGAYYHIRDPRSEYYGSEVCNMHYQRIKKELKKTI